MPSARFAGLTYGKRFGLSVTSVQSGHLRAHVPEFCKGSCVGAAATSALMRGPRESRQAGSHPERSSSFLNPCVRKTTVFVTSDALHIRPDPAVQARGAGSVKTDAKPSRLFLGPETDQPFGQTGRREVATIEDLARAAKLASIIRREFPARQDNHWDLRASRQGANAL